MLRMLDLLLSKYLHKKNRTLLYTDKFIAKFKDSQIREPIYKRNANMTATGWPLISALNIHFYNISQTYNLSEEIPEVHTFFNT